jgi:flavin-binding protein dodecin
MALLKVIEILSNSSKSWEDATSNAVKEASKTVNNIASVNVTNFSTTVKYGKVDEYRVNIKITFAVKH